MRKAILLILISILISCFEKDPVKFVKENKKDFREELSYENIRIFENLNLIFIEKNQNFIKSNDKLIKLVSYKYNSFGEDYFEDGIVNLKWRQISQKNTNFIQIFPEDLLILEVFFHIENKNSGKDILTYIAFHVIDKDTNDNDLLDEKNDLKSLYIYSLKNNTLKKISAKNVNVSKIEYSGNERISNSEFSSEYNLNNGVTTENNIILFTGSDCDTGKNNKYIYHINSDYTENITPLL